MKIITLIVFALLFVLTFSGPVAAFDKEVIKTSTGALRSPLSATPV